MSCLLALEALTIRTADRALVEGVSLEVRAGKITALVGPSGSGKSLTARALMGVIDVVPGLASGALRFPALGPEDRFAGVVGAGVDAHRRLAASMAGLRGAYVTYAPQSAASALNPGRTVGRHLELAIARRSTAPSEPVAAEVGRILAEVGLPPGAAALLPSELSGGMAQRAALALAIAPDPKILVADEPETGLDPVLRRVVTELMLGVASERGVALLLITHNMDTVRRIADDVVRIGGG